jgi:hypothetical protein
MSIIPGWRRTPAFADRSSIYVPTKTRPPSRNSNHALAAQAETYLKTLNLLERIKLQPAIDFTVGHTMDASCQRRSCPAQLETPTAAEALLRERPRICQL